MTLLNNILKTPILIILSLALVKGFSIKSIPFPSKASSISAQLNYQSGSEKEITFGTNNNMQTQDQRKDQTFFHVKSCWSKAGIGTCFVLEESKHKKFQLVFDLGCTPIFDKTMKVRNVVLSHAHLDHFGGIFSHARAHGMVCGGKTPTYYVPKEFVPKLEKARELFSDIDSTCRDDPKSQGQKREKGLLKMDIVPLEAGKEVELKQKKVHNGVRYFLRPFDVSHCGHPALGYTLVSRTFIKKLKEEFQGMDGKELGGLARKGVNLNTTEIVEKIEACYTGDTNLDGLMLGNEDEVQETTLAQNRRDLEEGFKAPLIICELTYLLESERELAKERGHMNLFDIQPILNSHKWGITRDDDQHYQSKKKFVFYHLSSRGRTAENILESIATVLPKNVADISDVSLASFSSKEMSHILKDNGCISISDFLNLTQRKSESS